MARVEISWSPNSPDKFVVVGTDISLFRVFATDKSYPRGSSAYKVCESAGDAVKLSRHSAACELSCNPDVFTQSHSVFKCFAWHPRPELEHLIAIGHSNGHVTIDSACLNQVDASGLLGREFAPKHSRACHDVCWNPYDSRYLAVCLDKNRGDRDREPCLLVWDVTTQSEGHQPDVMHEQRRLGPSSTGYRMAATTNVSNPSSLLFEGALPPAAASTISGGSNGRLSAVSSAAVLQKATFEASPGESVFSCDWLSVKSLVCGTHQKHIRVYDSRADLSKPQHSFSTRAVYGVRLDPQNSERLLSFVDDQICVFDLRFTDKPLLTVSESRPILKTRWDPLKAGVFSAVLKDSSVVKIYQLQRCVGDGTDFSYSEKAIRVSFPTPSATIASFDWHPSVENRLLAVSNLGQLAESIIFHRLPVCWSSSGNLAFGCCRFLRCYGASAVFSYALRTMVENIVKQVFECMGYGNRVEGAHFIDIADIMKNRVAAGYGSNAEDLEENGSMLGSYPNPEIEWIWQWVGEVKHLMKEKEKHPSWKFDVQIPGVNTVVGLRSQSQDLMETYSQGHVWKAYQTPERERALELLGWGNVQRNKGRINALIKRLEATGQPERAAALMTFTYRVQDAIEILAKAATTKPSLSYLNLVAMALAGYGGISEKEHAVHTNRTPAVLQDMCNNMLPTLSNPYLRAIFKFLSCKMSQSDYDPIISDPSLALPDRVACAILFTDHEKFQSLLARMTQQAIESGSLGGLLFTGIGSPESISLLERYVDLTGDVQTAALLLLHTDCLPSPYATEGTAANNKPPVFPAVFDAAAFVNPAARIYDAYRCLLNDWGLFYARAKLDCLRLLMQSQIRECSSRTFLGAESPVVDASLSGANADFANTSAGGANATVTLGSSFSNSNLSFPSYSPDIPNSPVGSHQISGAGSGTFSNSATSALTVVTSADGTIGDRGSPIAQLMPTINELAASISSSSSQHRGDAARMGDPHVPSQVFLSCTFCGRSIWLANRLKGKGVQAWACPSCRKPLPRCAVCHHRLGSITETVDCSTLGVSRFTTWFTWCQSCRHGGHAVHLIQWFKEHAECPVAGCTCKCSELDAQATICRSRHASAVAGSNRFEE